MPATNARIVFAIIALCGNVTSAADTANRPNIVFILADDLGYGDLGCYGQKRIATPNIDRLANEGIRFNNFYAGATVCAPSRCVLMTGLHGGHCYIRGNSNHGLRAADRTVVQMLKDAGYATGLFGKWGLGQEGSDGIPTKKGFDEFYGYLDQHHAHNYYPAFLIHDETRDALPNIVPGAGPYGDGVATTKRQYSADVIRDRALAFIDRNHDRPFFLYLASTLPHANNEAKPDGMEVPDYGAYQNKPWPSPQKGLAAMISRLDSDVGRLMDRLRSHGIERRTIVFFSSDNGPHHEGGNDPNFFDSNGPLRGFKRDLYEGGIRVPMIVRWPGHAVPGSTSDTIGYFGDFFATAAEIAGVACPTGLDSVSLVPSVQGTPERQRARDFLYWEFYENGSAQAVRIDNWKGVIRPMGSDHVELYDLGRDPGEVSDLAASRPDLVKRMLATARQAHVDSPIWSLRAARKADTARKRNP